jgi:hypothetical protein
MHEGPGKVGTEPYRAAAIHKIRSLHCAAIERKVRHSLRSTMRVLIWRTTMAKHNASAASVATQSTDVALAGLARHIQKLVFDQVLDSRCAAKFVKRLKKEGEAVAKSDGGSKADRKLLLDTFESLDAALFEQNATLLVAANASLRETEVEVEVEVEVEGKHKKHHEARAVLIS